MPWLMYLVMGAVASQFPIHLNEGPPHWIGIALLLAMPPLAVQIDRAWLRAEARRPG